MRPVLRAMEAKRIVEIGALRGETTVLMLETLGPDAELHVIDPVPEFDPTEHEQAFPGRYIFHRDVSLDVLRQLPGDGRRARSTATTTGTRSATSCGCSPTSARKDDAPLPVLILHDVLWPYGRRDLYYAPERIPEEFRQPYAQKGMRPGTEQAATDTAGSTRRSTTPSSRAGRATA